ncbi:hypothetical protein GCM10023340_41710 [Nocardioides marinquilinus]|uniref:Mycothiol-dependent maleylpyruvate isomerase metal-binding domain-containing protein n=1 Tax=Nocardioides marinquilinus TaxID=1210400 RepID=A0ABP9Q3C9_9ACTN
MTDWGALYRDHVSAIAALAGDLDDEQLTMTVPASPAWTVRDVLAHLAGGPADAVTGRMDGAPSPEWTARHVAERTHLPVPELVAELETNRDVTAERAAEAQTPAVVWDIAVHHADLHEALGRGRLSDHLWRPIVDELGPQRTPDLVGVLEPYELFRALFSRRSRTQLDDAGVPGDRVDAVGIFGPRDDDQPVPA